MRAVPIEYEGREVLPSLETVIDGTYLPLSRPLFIYVKDSSAQRPEVRKFIEFYLTQGPKLVEEVGFVPLPDQASQIALKHFHENRLGTVFSGTPEIGITVDELLTREATQ